ncbi:MAG TPA: hypothetical protein VM674_00830 [Candidatus Acidoferrum sp.]|nr:hypothetical protein [Candidatus Acidoferrum sp.]
MAKESQKGDKPCICHIKKSGWPWKPTGNLNAEKQAEYQCRVCGRTHWVPA